MAGAGIIREVRDSFRDIVQGLKSTFTAQPDNPLVAAWLLEGQRRDEKRRFQPYILISTLALVTLLITWLYMGQRPVSSQTFVPSGAGYNYFAKSLPLFAMAWALPLVYGAVRDALSALGTHREGVGGWHGFLAQLRDAPVTDATLLTALTRITWPRLVIAAWGSAAMLWLLMLICGWPVSGLHWLYYSHGDLFNELAFSGWKLVALMGINGSLAGLATVLCCLVLGRTLPGFAAPAVGALIYCLHTVQLATVSLNADHWPRGYHLPLGHILPAIAVLLVAWGLILALAARLVPFRRFLSVSWLIALSSISWVISFVTEFARPVGTQTPEQLYSFIWLQASWLMSTHGLLNPGIYPGILEVSSQACVTQLAGSFDHTSFLLGYLAVVLFQVAAILMLALFALSSVKRWRSGEG